MCSLIACRSSSKPRSSSDVNGVDRAAGVDDEAAQGDLQLHQEPAPGGGRPERPPVRPHGHHGPQQPRRRDHPQPPPLAEVRRPSAIRCLSMDDDLSSI